MNVLRKLTAVAAEETPNDLRLGIAMHDEPVAGFIRQVRVGSSGVMLIAGEAQVLVPTAELFALAAAIDPRFVPAAAAPRGQRGGAA